MSLGGRGAAVWKRWGVRHAVSVQLVGLVMVVPAIVLMCSLLIAPFIMAVRWGFTEKSTSALGLANYGWLIRGVFAGAMGRSLYVAVGSVALELVVAVPLAILLNQRLPGRGLIRAAVTLPWAVPTICVATALLWLSNAQYGLLNQVALATGITHTNFSLFGSPQTALPAVTVVHAWKGLPLVFVIILASLQSLPTEYLEAAKVDGAWRMAQFRHIILPHLRSSIGLAAVVSGAYNFSHFDITYLLTGGGPAGMTTTFPLLLYNQQFRALDTGRAAAVGVSIFVVCITMQVGWLLFSRSRERRSRA